MFCSRKPGLLLSIMRALDNLGLDIQQAVISCFNGFALDVFRAEVVLFSFSFSPVHVDFQNLIWFFKLVVLSHSWMHIFALAVCIIYLLQTFILFSAIQGRSGDLAWANKSSAIGFSWFTWHYISEGVYEMKQVGLPLMDGIIDVFYAPTDSVNPTTFSSAPSYT